MITRTLAALAIALATVVPAFAEDEVDAAIQEQLTTMLTAQGYEVRKIEAEDGLIEVYVVKDGEATKLWFNDKLEPVEHDGSDE